MNDEAYITWLEAQTPGYDADTVLDVVKYLAELDVVPSLEHVTQALHDRFEDFQDDAEAEYWDKGEYVRAKHEMLMEVRAWERKAAQRMNEELNR